MRPIVAQRIELGHEMPQLAIGVNQIINPHAQRRRRQAGPIPLGALNPHFKPREKRPPLLGDRARVFLVLLVKLVDVLGVGTIDEIKIEGLHE